MKISIIVPVYNVGEYLPKCLDSLIGQTYKNIEIICINDESTDESENILKSYAEKDSRIIIINQKNQGVSAARTKGVMEAKGDWILFVDGDDWIDLETCEKALKKALETNVDIVFWGYQKEFCNSSVPKHLYSKSQIFNLQGCNVLQRRVLGLVGDELANPAQADSIIPVWSKLYRSQIVKGIEFVDLKVIGTAEDALFNLEAFGKASFVYYMKETYYHYRKNNTASVTKVYNTNLINKWKVLFKKMELFIPDDNNKIGYEEALNNRISLSIIGVGLNELACTKKSIREKYIAIKEYLFSELYRNAIKDLSLKYFPIHWKMFFLFCKHNFTLGTYILLLIIRLIVNR